MVGHYKGQIILISEVIMGTVNKINKIKGKVRPKCQSHFFLEDLMALKRAQKLRSKATF